MSRPCDRLAIASRNQEEPLPHGRSSIICRHQLPELHFVSQISKLLDKFMKRFSLLCLDRMLPTPQRSPRLKLFDILQHYHAWTYQTCPAAGNPRQTANKLVLWLPALCFAEMLTIWRKPRQRHRMPATYFDRIYLPHILAVMLRVRVVCLMHLDRLWIMIDRDIYTVPCRFFDAGACPAAPSKVIYYQFSVNHRPHSPLALSSSSQISS